MEKLIHDQKVDHIIDTLLDQSYGIIFSERIHLTNCIAPIPFIEHPDSPVIQRVYYTISLCNQTRYADTYQDYVKLNKSYGIRINPNRMCAKCLEAFKENPLRYSLSGHKYNSADHHHIFNPLPSVDALKSTKHEHISSTP